MFSEMLNNTTRKRRRLKILTIFGTLLKKLKGILSSADFLAVSAMMEIIDLLLRVLIGHSSRRHRLTASRQKS